jgi:hypothetical protein
VGNKKKSVTFKQTVRTRIIIAWKTKINKVKGSYQSVTILVKDEKGQMTAHSHSNFKTWKNSFYPFDAEIKSLRAMLPASYLKGSLCNVFINRSA